jgi:predicted ATPase
MVGGESALLEREEQLDELTGALARVARTSRGALALVAGEAGAGKTELLRTFAERAHSARVLWATCGPLSAPRPLGPFLNLADGLDGELARQLEAGAQPHEIAATFRRALDGPSPTVLVLEDAQWADEATLDVIRLLARRH